MEKEFLAVYIFVMFGYNFPRPEDFIGYICEKCGKNDLKEHLKAKFSHILEKYGCYAAMNYFLTDLDRGLREALVDYAINVWAKEHMTSKYAAYNSL